MRILKYFSIGTVFWFVIFAMNSIYELFQINETSVVKTFMGLRITTKMTSEELTTYFTLTWQVLMIYIVFIVIFIIIMNLINFKKVKNHDI